MTEITAEIKCICRLCLSNQPTIHIFSNELSLLRKIQSCFAIQIYENDGLPEHICVQCSNTLDVILNFKSQCEENDKLLRSRLFADVTNIKNEYSSSENLDFNSYNYVQTSAKNIKKESTIEIEEDVTYNNSDDLSEDENSNLPLAKIKLIKKKISKKNNIKKADEKKLCPYCGKIFIKMNYLNNHIRTHRMSNADKLFECNVCLKQFSKKWRLKEHQKTHVDVKEFSCEICNKMFKTARDVQRHVKIVHNRDRVAECKLCGRKLATCFGLKMHMKIHTGEKTFECNICKQQFTFKHSLIVHMRIHTGEKPYLCRFCDSRFSALKTLKEHERIHTGETPYSCPICSKGFSQLSNMKSHFRNNHKGVELNYKFARPRNIINM